MTRTHCIVISVLSWLCAVPQAVAAEPATAPDVEQILSAAPNAASYGKHLLLLTEEPHMAGTERNHALAEYVRDRFREYGLDEVNFHEFPALLEFPQVRGARDPHARGTNAEPARGPLPRRQGLAALRRPGAGGLPWLRAFGKGPRRGGLRQRRQPRGFPAPGPHGHRSQGQDRADAVLEPVLVPRLQGLRGRATRRSGNDHLFRPGRGRIPEWPGLSRRSLGPGIAHRVGRHHLRLARAGRTVHVSLEEAAGRPMGRRTGARQAAAAHPVDAAQCA